MPSVFDTVTGLLAQGDRTERLAGVMGTNNEAVDAVHRAGTPALLEGLAERLHQPDGERAVLDLLDGDRDSALAHVDRFIDDGDPRLGNGILNSLTGGHPSDLVDRVAGRSGIGPAMAGQVLPMLAPLVVGALAWARTSEGLDEAGLAELLDTERADLGSRGLLDAPAVPVEADEAIGVGAVGAAAAAGSALSGSARAGGGSGGPATQADGGSSTPDGDTTGPTRATAAAAAPARNGSGPDASAPVAAQPRTSGIQWLWWALIGVALIAVAAIGLSRCEGDVDSPISAGGALTTAAPAPAGTAPAAVVTTVPTTAAPTTSVAPVTTTPTTAAPNTTAPAPGSTAPASPTTVAAPAPSRGATINELLSLAPVTFDTGSSRITPAGQKVLDQAATYLTTYPAVRVEIGGHTDTDGGSAYNQKLSQARADAVKTYLVGRGIDAGRMTTKGYGDTVPKVANDTAANKAVNRRIEFTIQ